MTNFINVALAVVLAFGAMLAMQANRRKVELQDEFNQLVAKHGWLPVDDKDKIHLIRLDTDDPMHFRWRVYQPAKQALQWKSPSSSSSGSSSQERNFISQVRFRFIDEERVDVFYSHASGSGRGSIWNGPGAKFLREHWDELEITVAGGDGLESYGPDELATLIEVRIPDPLYQKMLQEHPRLKYRGQVPYSRKFGTKQAFDAAEAAAAMKGQTP